MMYVDCQCGQEVKAADHVAGTLRKCQRCGAKVQFPTDPNDARRFSVKNVASEIALDEAVLPAQPPKLPRIVGSTNRRVSAGGIALSLVVMGWVLEFIGLAPDASISRPLMTDDIQILVLGTAGILNIVGGLLALYGLVRNDVPFSALIAECLVLLFFFFRPALFITLWKVLLAMRDPAGT